MVFQPLGMLKCRSCGFIYRDDVISSDIYVNSPAYASAAVDEGVVAARRREAKKRAAIVATHVGPGALVLEIGSNEGALLEGLRDLGIRAVGIEPDPAMVEFSRKKGLEVLQGTLEENMSHLAGGYDAVVLFHVLEHINRPVEALDMIHRSLKKGGKLIFEVPGIDSPMFSARKWHASWAIKEHLSYFTFGTVKAILDRTGFKPILLTRRNWDSEYETFRNNFLRLPAVSLLYRAYRRVKERFEPFQSRTAVLAERPVEKRERARGCAAVAAKLVEVLERGDALFVVAEKSIGLPSRRSFFFKDVYENFQMVFLLVTALFFLPLSILRKRGGKNILVIPTSKLGDLTAQIPFFKALRNKFPDQKISSLLFNPKLACLLDGLVDEVIISKGLSLPELFRVSAQCMRYGFSKAYILPWGGRMDFLAYFSRIPERFAVYSGMIPFASRFPRFLLSTGKSEFMQGDFSTSVYLGLLGAERGVFSREVSVRKEWTESMKNKLCTVRPEREKLAGVVVGCGNRVKLWAPEKLAQVSDWLHEKGYGVLLIGSAADSEFAAGVKAHSRYEVTDATGVFTLEELAPFFMELELVVGVDTGPLYLASAMGVKVVDISGPFEPTEQLSGDNTLAVRPDAGCAPCSYVMASARSCRFGTRRCLTGFEAANVTAALQGLLCLDVDGLGATEQ